MSTSPYFTLLQKVKLVLKINPSFQVKIVSVNIVNPRNIPEAYYIRLDLYETNGFDTDVQLHAIEDYFEVEKINVALPHYKKSPLNQYVLMVSV